MVTAREAWTLTNSDKQHLTRKIERPWLDGEQGCLRKSLQMPSGEGCSDYRQERKAAGSGSVPRGCDRYSARWGNRGTLWATPRLLQCVRRGPPWEDSSPQGTCDDVWRHFDDHNHVCVRRAGDRHPENGY